MTAPTQHQNGRFRWEAVADWEPLLFGPEGLRFPGWHQEGRVRLVKDGAHRAVYQVVASGRAFYVKQYRRERLIDRLGHLARPSAARREWRNTAEIARRGIPTVRPVAWVEEVCGGLVRDSYFITEAIGQALSLEQYLLDELPRRSTDVQRTMRPKIIEGLARFVAAMHRAGVFQDDFHAGNVLVRMDTLGSDTPGDGGPPKLHLIDVPGVRFSGPLKWRASRRSLVMLNAAWRHRVSQSDRLRFWRTYLTERPDLKVPGERKALEQLDRDSRAYSRRIACRRDKRALRTNRDFVALRLPGREAHAVKGLPQPLLRELSEDPERLLRLNLDRPVKLSHTRVIVQAGLPLDGRSVEVALKRYRPRNWWKALWGVFRRSRALRGWCMGHALLARGIATARPVAVCDMRRPWYSPRSYLATEWIDGAENLHQYGWRLAASDPSDRLRRAARCAESLGRLLGRMHSWQVRHGDLKGANLLVVEQGEELKTYVIDAEDARPVRRLSLARRARDLARLATSIQAHPWVSRTMLCRFLGSYVREFAPGSVAWKPLWRGIARRSGRMVLRKRRRGKAVL